MPDRKKKKSQWANYEVRTGKDGKPGIYSRNFNCRLATFNTNTYVLQQALARLFDQAANPKRRPPRKPPRNTGAFSGDVGDQGFSPIKMLRSR